MRNISLLDVIGAGTPWPDVLLFAIPLIGTVATLLLLRRRLGGPAESSRRAPQLILEILEPADEAAETVGVGDRVRLRVTLSGAPSDARVILQSPGGAVHARTRDGRATLTFRPTTPGAHEPVVRVTDVAGRTLAEEVFPLRVVRYEEAVREEWARLRAAAPDTAAGMNPPVDGSGTRPATRSDYLALLRANGSLAARDAPGPP